MDMIRTVRFLKNYSGPFSGEMFHAKGEIVSEATPPALLQVDKLFKDKTVELFEEGMDEKAVAKPKAKPKAKAKSKAK